MKTASRTLLYGLIANALLLSATARAADESACDARGVAGDDIRATSQTDGIHLDDLDDLRRLAQGHPNERYRFAAAKHAAGGRWQTALKNFEHASKHADKFSQHRISLMYWYGCGVSADPSAAYAWADLAAERLYPDFVVLRERIWKTLDDAQRKRAIEIGTRLYAEHGDHVAKPRFARALAQSLRNKTGSRTGFDNRLDVFAASIGGDPRASPIASGVPVANLGGMYRPERWDPEQYWKQEDYVWRQASVLIGPLQEANIVPARP